MEKRENLAIRGGGQRFGVGIPYPAFVSALEGQEWCLVSPHNALKCLLLGTHSQRKSEISTQMTVVLNKSVIQWALKV